MKHLLEKHGFSVISSDKSGDFTSAIYQMRMVYVSEHFIPSIPLLGKNKFFKTSIAPGIYFLMNSWYSFKHWILPKRTDWYLNNIILAEKL
ncbi:MAG: hypothetical protein WDO71_16785 [Bacteroidota bacterium]